MPDWIKTCLAGFCVCGPIALMIWLGSLWPDAGLWVLTVAAILALSVFFCFLVGLLVRDIGGEIRDSMKKKKKVKG